MFRFHPESALEHNEFNEVSAEAAEMTDLYLDICNRSDDVITLRHKIDDFLHELEDRLGLDTLLHTEAYYILTNDFDRIHSADRFDLDEEYSLRHFLETLQ